MRKVSIPWSVSGNNSDLVKIEGDVVALETGATLVGTSFTFKVSRREASETEKDYHHNSGTAYSLGVGANEMNDLPKDFFRKIYNMLVVSNGTETAATTLWAWVDEDQRT